MANHVQQFNTSKVIIIGGGLSGSCVAICLAGLLGNHPSLTNQKHQITVIEKSPISSSKFTIGETLAAEVKPALKTLGLLDLLESEVHRGLLILRKYAGVHSRSIGTSSAWGSNELLSSSSIFNPYGSGYHLDRVKFNEMVLSAVEEKYSEYVTVLRGNRVCEICRIGVNDLGEDKVPEDMNWKIKICPTGGNVTYTSLYASVLVDASGRQSLINKALPITRISHDKLLAFYCLFAAHNSKNMDVYSENIIESTQHGWCYTTRLPNDTRLVVVHVDEDSKIQIRKASDYVKFINSETNFIANVLAKGYTPIWPRVMCTSAKSEVLSCPGSSEDHFLAVGDAAMSVDPLSGQGMLLAVSNAKLAGEAIFLQHFQHAQSATGLRPLNVYNAHIKAIWEDYLKHWDWFYRREKRWPDMEFWSRRQQ